MGRRTRAIERRRSPRRAPTGKRTVRLAVAGRNLVAEVQDAGPGGLRVAVRGASGAAALVRALTEGARIRVLRGARRTQARVVWVGRSLQSRVVAGLHLEGVSPETKREGGVGVPVGSIHSVRHRSPKNSPLVNALGEFFVRTAPQDLRIEDAGDLLCAQVRRLTGAERVEFRSAAVGARDPRSLRRASQKGEQLFVNGLVADAPRPDWLPWADVRSAMIIPVVGIETDFGVLLCGHGSDPFAFGIGAQRAAEVLASQAVLVFERARAEETLCENEERYRLLIEHSPDAIAVHRDGRVLYVNEASVRMFAAGRPADLVGRPVLDFVLPAEAEHVTRRIRRITEGEPTIEAIEQRLVRTNGEVFEAEVIGIGVRFGGEPAVQVVIRDLSERRRREATLRENEEKFRKIFHQGIDGITLNSATEGLYLDVNEEFLKLTGWRREEVVGRLPKDLGIWVRSEDFRAVLRDLSSPGFIRNLEAPFRMKDGSEIIGLYSGMRVEIAGRPCILSFVRDVTELKAGERELTASRQQLALSEKLSALGRLVSGVAHEIRTPSAYIANNLFLIRHRLGDMAARHPDCAEHVSEIEALAKVALEGVGRIDRLVKDLRPFGRQEVGGRVEASLDRVVEVAVNIFRAVQRGRIELDTALGATPVLSLDAERIQQVVLNLLHNAVEAGSRVIAVTTREARGGGEIEVRDNGPGISPEVEARLFDPFFTTKAEGTGLGLSIARRIVEAHGGTIGYETRQGSGTRFVVFVPGGVPAGGEVRA